MLQKVGKKVGIHFYENVLSEINLPLIQIWPNFRNDREQSLPPGIFVCSKEYTWKKDAKMRLRNKNFQEKFVSQHYIIHTRINIYSEMPQKTGKKVGIHFYENVLSEINLPLMVSAYGPQFLF